MPDDTGSGLAQSAPSSRRGPSPARVAAVLQAFFGLQLLAFLLIVAGGVLLMVTFAHNTSVDCPDMGFGGSDGGRCAQHSYAWPVGLLTGGFGLFVVMMFVTTQYALRHVGAPLLGALRAKRRVLEQQAQQRSTTPPAG